MKKNVIFKGLINKQKVGGIDFFVCLFVWEGRSSSAGNFYAENETVLKSIFWRVDMYYRA